MAPELSQRTAWVAPPACPKDTPTTTPLSLIPAARLTVSPGTTPKSMTVMSANAGADPVLVNATVTIATTPPSALSRR